MYYDPRARQNTVHGVGWVAMSTAEIRDSVVRIYALVRQATDQAGVIHRPLDPEVIRTQELLGDCEEECLKLYGAVTSD